MTTQQAAAQTRPAENAHVWGQRVRNYLVIPLLVAGIAFGLGFLAYKAPWKQTAFAEVGTWGTAIRCGNSTNFVHGTFNTVDDKPILILLDDCSDRHPAGTLIDLRTRQLIPPFAAPGE